MLERTTRLVAIEFGDDGTVGLKIMKRLVIDGKVEKDEPHRTVVPPGVDFDLQMQAVADDLAGMGFAPPPAEQLAIARMACTGRDVQSRHGGRRHPRAN